MKKSGRLYEVETSDKILGKFLTAGRKLSDFLQDKTVNDEIPEPLLYEYDNRLYAYRAHLHKLGIRMPKPKYFIDKEDPNTWIYKKCKIVPNKRGFKVTWFLNEDCYYYKEFMKEHGMI